MCSLDLADRIGEPRVDLALVDERDHRLLGEQRSRCKLRGPGEHGFECVCDACRQLLDRASRARELILRPGKERRRTERVKTQAEYANPARGLQHELGGQLAGEEQPRLDGPRRAPFRDIDTLERIPEMKDQFRAAVGQHDLRLTREHLGMALERPDPVHERRKSRNRVAFDVVHRRGRSHGRSHLFKHDPARQPRLAPQMKRMAIHKISRNSFLLVLVTAVATSTAAQQRPDYSGGWVATKDVPSGLPAAPSPVFGPRFWIEHKGDQLTLVRPIRETAVAITHTLGGGEVRTRVPGPMCLGDSTTITSVSWEADAVVHRINGTIVPGSTTVIPSGARQTFRKAGPDSIVVEGVTRLAGSTDPVTVATVYTRMADKPPAAPVPAVKTAPATLERLQWLAGTWSGGTATTTTEERWTPASGGSMLAVSRTVRNGSVSAFEFLCIAERGGGLVYTAMPNGRSPATDFTLTAIDDTSATFENPSHDFPKMIRYAVRPDGTLEATISGGSGSKPTTFVFKKQ